MGEELKDLLYTIGYMIVAVVGIKILQKVAEFL